MSLSKWIGKRVKHTRKPPNNHIVSIGTLERKWTGHYEIKDGSGGTFAAFDGDTIEYNGKVIAIKYG